MLDSLKAQGLRALSLAALVASQTLAADPPAAKPFTLRVLDSGTKQPLANVQIKYSGENNKLLRAATDAEGKFVFNLPATTRTVYIQMSEPTHVPVTLRWNPQQEPGRDSYDALLPVAVPISGRVQDEAGEPIAGAKVQFSLMNERNSEWPHAQAAVGQETATTDESGVWTFSQTPEDVSSLTMGVFHPQYVVNERNEAYYSYERVSNPASLRDGSHAVTLKKGVAITGKVIDADGKPVPTANVAIGTDRFPSNIVPPVKVDAEGKFTLAAMPGAPLTITATAKGKAPDLQVIQVTSTPPEVTMTLGNPQTLAGKVVDADGKPIRGVTVAVDTWRGSRTIQKRMSTNAEGKFTWTEAPADEVLVDVLDGKHASNRNVKMSAGKENLVTLSAPLTVTATVVDDATGQPVPKFNVIQGIKFDESRQISWQRYDSERFGSAASDNGTFTREFNEGYPGIALRVEASGYLPAESPAWPTNAGKVSYAFRLKKGRDVAGVVTGAEGKPLANVQALLAVPGRPTQLQNGQVPPYMRDNLLTRTDEQGKFSFPPQTGKYTVVLIDDSGYAEVPSERFEKDSPKIELQRWGRVEGLAFIGSKPAAEVTIDGSAMRSGDFENAPAIWPTYEAKTDETGKFVFERVTPGIELSIGRRIPLANSSYTTSRSDTVTVQAGETKTVRVGGTGRPVTGRIVLDPSLTGQTWGWYNAGLHTARPNSILPPQPAGFDKMSADEKKAYWTNWQKTDEGKAYRARLMGQERATKHYTFALETDGTFRIDDVEPGTYTMQIQLHKPSNDRHMMSNEMLGMARADIVVPPIANGMQSDEAVTVADVVVKPQEEFRNGGFRSRRATSAPTTQGAN